MDIITLGKKKILYCFILFGFPSAVCTALFPGMFPYFSWFSRNMSMYEVEMWHCCYQL